MICMVHSWYLPCDFHYFIIAVFIMYNYTQTKESWTCHSRDCNFPFNTNSVCHWTVVYASCSIVFLSRFS
ncbi:hypothetical protein NQ314_013294 [Rhamnusium bicolor]|uniref:Uncharacterized protein n=1 Tax=Rhamnusium bicolor TaxID=1586634 RepID=A0AAV8X7T2_9CUCU|nr:hypothetical protein NQ314_013294 [Rhamnusium bicolor]